MAFASRADEEEWVRRWNTRVQQVPELDPEMGKAALRVAYKEVKGYAPAFESNDVFHMRREIYWARMPEDVARSDTPHRIPAKSHEFTPNASRSRSRRGYVPSTFDKKNPASSKVISRDTRYRVSDDYEQFHMFIATQEFLHEIAHVASKHQGKMVFNQYFLRRFNMSRVGLGGLGQRMTPVYCSQYLTVASVTASLIVWRVGLATLNGGFYVNQVIRFLQSIGIGKPRDAESFDTFNPEESIAQQDDNIDESKSSAFRYSTGRARRSKSDLSEKRIFHRVIQALVPFVLRYADGVEKRRLDKWAGSGKRVKAITDARYDSGV